MPWPRVRGERDRPHHASERGPCQRRPLRSGPFVGSRLLGRMPLRVKSSRLDSTVRSRSVFSSGPAACRGPYLKRTGRRIYVMLPIPRLSSRSTLLTPADDGREIARPPAGVRCACGPATVSAQGCLGPRCGRHRENRQGCRCAHSWQRQRSMHGRGQRCLPVRRPFRSPPMAGSVPDQPDQSVAQRRSTTSGQAAREGGRGTP
jgi:hypothetical protein